MSRVTDGDDVDAASSRSHCLTPRQRRVVRVAVRQNQQVVGHAQPVSVTRLEHHVRRETANDIAQHIREMFLCLTKRKSELLAADAMDAAMPTGWQT